MSMSLICQRAGRIPEAEQALSAVDGEAMGGTARGVNGDWPARERAPLRVAAKRGTSGRD